ncbi:MAG: hypothetical protein SVK54_05345 [candidate division WOR-3 bacterium]|nr:hypothetical protein [candidate division WOR-3 bacterium]
MVKKLVVSLMIISVLSTTTLAAGPLFSIDKQDGGIVPMALSCLVDPRLGLMANEKAVNFDLMDILRFVPTINFLVMFGNAYTGFKNQGITGCCIGPFGYHTAHSLDKYKPRTKEWMSYILIGWIMIGMEANSGKTWSEVVKEENLRK